MSIRIKQIKRKYESSFMQKGDSLNDNLISTNSNSFDLYLSYYLPEKNRFNSLQINLLPVQHEYPQKQNQKSKLFEGFAEIKAKKQLLTRGKLQQTKVKCLNMKNSMINQWKQKNLHLKHANFLTREDFRFEKEYGLKSLIKKLSASSNFSQKDSFRSEYDNFIQFKQCKSNENSIFKLKDQTQHKYPKKRSKTHQKTNKDLQKKYEEAHTLSPWNTMKAENEESVLTKK